MVYGHGAGTDNILGHRFYIDINILSIGSFAVSCHIK